MKMVKCSLVHSSKNWNKKFVYSESYTRYCFSEMSSQKYLVWSESWSGGDCWSFNSRYCSSSRISK